MFKRIKLYSFLFKDSAVTKYLCCSGTVVLIRPFFSSLFRRHVQTGNAAFARVCLKCTRALWMGCVKSSLDDARSELPAA